MRTVYLGIGTNIGDKRDNLKRAIHELSLALNVCPMAVSSFLETEPWGFQSNNNFLNCVVSFSVNCSALELLEITESVERNLGRIAKSRGRVYSDRLIDIDILLFGDEIVETPRLTIPHRFMHERLFVLQPLSEIAPNLVHPKLKKSVSMLLKELLN